MLFDLSPNRDYIQKVVGKDKADVVAADMRDLPALLSALEKFNVDTLVHYRRIDRLARPRKFLYRRDQQYSRHDQCPGSCALAQTRRVVYVSTFGVYDRGKITDSVIRETHPIGGHNLYATTKVCSEHLVHAYASMYNLDTIIIRPGGVFGRGFYVGGSTVGKVMRDLALNMIKGEPITIDAKTYGPNEYVYGKDVGLALFLACQAQNPKQRIYNAGTGVVHGAEELAQVVRELAPKTEVKVSGTSGADKSRSIPMDISVSKAELGYAPKFPLKEALRDYMDELWADGARP